MSRPCPRDRLRAGKTCVNGESNATARVYFPLALTLKTTATDKTEKELDIYAGGWRWRHTWWADWNLFQSVAHSDFCVCDALTTKASSALSRTTQRGIFYGSFEMNRLTKLRYWIWYLSNADLRGKYMEAIIALLSNDTKTNTKKMAVSSPDQRIS